MIKLNDLENLLIEKLKNQLPSRSLLDRLRVFDELSRKSSQYQDPNYFPFYYYLSKFISPKSLLQIGLNLGLHSCCFLKGNNSVENFLGFQNKSNIFYNNKLALHNLKDVSKKINIDYYYGDILDDQFHIKLNKINWDLVFINEQIENEEIRKILDVVWNSMSLDGCLVIDYVTYSKNIKELFVGFCKSNNRDYILLPTRYGTGIVMK